jgi:capsular polysaccharide biosynthesis protein
MVMELVAILRLLWRHRVLVLLAGLVAVLVGLSTSYRIGFPPKLESRHYQVGIGSATALVDTPNSQVVDLGPDTGSDIQTLSTRASLLANLITSSPLKDQIAAKAGIRTDELDTSAPDAATGETADVVLKGKDQTAHVLTAAIANLDSGQIPIISVSTQAPDAAGAAALADASISVLQRHILTMAGTDKVPARRRVVVRELGPARSTTVSRGPSPIVGLLIGLLVLVVGCASIVGVSALRRGWRRAAELERLAREDYDPLGADEAAIIEANAATTRLTAVDLPPEPALRSRAHRDDARTDDDEDPAADEEPPPAARTGVLTWPRRGS